MTEILAPAGDEERAIVALNAGANALYLGLSAFSARASATNFDCSGLERTARRAHLLGAKVYVALNTLVKDSETQEFFSLAKEAWNAGADAILLQDLFLGKELKARYPQIVMHLSTQAGCCNEYAARFAKECGFSRVVLSRETPLAEIEKISKIVETEVFVQGALCTAFSGQCYFSSFAGNMSGNRGRCKQPCRKRYTIDRKGYEGEAYALSLSDLCVGERVKELISAGVSSLKIEGRMRRKEYVAAAVKYYRSLLNGEAGREEFTALKRAYNRGDYTAGLAFGQEKLLSRKVQGHIGERVGEIAMAHGKPFCVSSYAATAGDGFKILRAGKEVGGAVFASSLQGGFFLKSEARLKAGDEVRLTTSVKTNAEIACGGKKRTVAITAELLAGKLAKISACGVTYCGEEPLENAKTAPLGEAEIVACLNKSEYFSPTVTVKTDGVFLPKAKLNELRRGFYALLFEHFTPAREPLVEAEFACTLTPERGALCATIGERPPKDGIFVYKPRDYAKLDERVFAYCGEKFLYLPPFFTSEDERTIAEKIKKFDGIYCEGTYGVLLAKKYGVALFAGTGWNLSNRFSVRAAQSYAKYLALSKEISFAEQNALAGKGAFALTAGAIKVMDLIYCPFERTCAQCDKRGEYILTDEAGRKFPLKRYRFKAGECRFEVYNCAALEGEGGLPSALIDDSVTVTEKTSGHRKRSVL